MFPGQRKFPVALFKRKPGPLRSALLFRALAQISLLMSRRGRARLGVQWEWVGIKKWSLQLMAFIGVHSQTVKRWRIVDLGGKLLMCTMWLIEESQKKHQEI